ncbi:hypothetical protein DFH11DRAFT_1618922 [Phellopilus nigrolimitatus]|nr:hypothetical protein DFH11DRAFT_1618922 [Phellopilus nigrolimitatus]
MSKPFCVASPFSSDDAHGADVILRSSDGFDFHVIKAILSVASPIFKDMFSLPQPIPISSLSNEHHSDLAIVDLSESGVVLDALLRDIYPVVSLIPDLKDVQLMIGILLSARKYNMDLVIHNIESPLHKSIENGGNAALKLYSLASMHRLEGEARIAAFATLKSPTMEAFEPELGQITGAEYYHLLDYHRKVADKILSFLNRPAYDFINDLWRSQSPVCTEHDYYVTNWWFTYQRTYLTPEVKKAPLSIAVLSLELCIKAITSCYCKNCSEDALCHLPELLKRIKEKITDVALGVMKLVIPWVE